MQKPINGESTSSLAQTRLVKSSDKKCCNWTSGVTALAIIAALGTLFFGLTSFHGLGFIGRAIGSANSIIVFSALAGALITSIFIKCCQGCASYCPSEKEE